MKTKSLIAGLTVPLIALICNCSTTTARYEQDKSIPYTFSNGRHQITGKLDPLHYDLAWNKPIGLGLRYSQSLPMAENLKSVEIKLFAAESGTNYTQELTVESSEISVEYWNGKTITEVKKTNFKGDFHSLIDPSMKDYERRESVTPTFWIENRYSGSHPDKLLQKIIIRWTDKPDEVYTSILTKKTTTKDCISGRPFG